MYGTIDRRPARRRLSPNHGAGAVFEIRNGSGDRSFSVTAQLEKRFANGTELSAAYTYTREGPDELEDAPGPNTGLTPVNGTLEDRELRTSFWERPHKVTLLATTDLPLGFRFGLTYFGGSGAPFTYPNPFTACWVSCGRKTLRTWFDSLSGDAMRRCAASRGSRASAAANRRMPSPRGATVINSSPRVPRRTKTPLLATSSRVAGTSSRSGSRKTPSCSASVEAIRSGERIPWQRSTSSTPTPSASARRAAAASSAGSTRDSKMRASVESSEARCRATPAGRARTALAGAKRSEAPQNVRIPRLPHYFAQKARRPV